MFIKLNKTNYNYRKDVHFFNIDIAKRPHRRQVKQLFENCSLPYYAIAFSTFFLTLHNTPYI